MNVAGAPCYTLGRRRTTLYARAIALAALLALSTPHAQAQDGTQDRTVEFKLSHFMPTSHPLHRALEEWAASIEKASRGTIDYKIYPAQQLGKAFDQYDMVRDHIVDVALVVPSYQPGRFPIIGAGELPFSISAGVAGSRALDAWYREYAGSEMRDVKFCLAFVHRPGAFHANRKIVVPDDVKGMKVRPANATVASFVTLLGGTNVQASAPEVRTILEKGVADAVTFPAGTTAFFGIDQILKYHMDAPLYTTAFVIVINKAAYDGLLTVQKAVVDEHCTSDWAARVAGPFDEFEHVGEVRLRTESSGVYELTPEQVALWKKAAEPLQKEWFDTVRKIGVNPVTAMDGLRDELVRQNAAY